MAHALARTPALLDTCLPARPPLTYVRTYYYLLYSEYLGALKLRAQSPHDRLLLFVQRTRAPRRRLKLEGTYVRTHARTY